MQTTGSLRTIGRSGALALVLTAVGALGLVIGRWVVPATDSAPAGVYQRIEAPAVGRAADILERKLAQMDSADARAGATTEVAGAVSAGRAADILERKLARMDLADARAGATTEVAGAVSAGRAAHILELKLAQMDAADAR